MPQNQSGEPIHVSDIFDVSDVLQQDDASNAVASEQVWESEAGVVAAPPGATTDEDEEIGLSSSLSVGDPSEPLLGRLPLARIIPQDVHSVLDYVDAGGVMAGALLSNCPQARAASLLIGSAGAGVSALTDYRLSLAKVIPIETHETIDYAFGVAAIAAPFVLGYRKTAPVVAALHVAIGAGTILASLFTDYRAYRGVGRRAA
jgi:hypothetical protein